MSYSNSRLASCFCEVLRDTLTHEELCAYLEPLFEMGDPVSQKPSHKNLKDIIANFI